MRGTGLFHCVAAACLWAAPTSLFAASAAATASANIVVPITIINTSGLAFGDIQSGASVGTVTLEADGSRSATGGSLLVPGSSGALATFSVSGDPGATYSITLPDSATLADGSGNVMVVSGFTSAAGATGQLGADGTESLAVGATLQINAEQPVGTYSGTFQVTLDYN